MKFKACFLKKKNKKIIEYFKQSSVVICTQHAIVSVINIHIFFFF